LERELEWQWRLPNRTSDASIDAQTCCHEAKLKGELKSTERSEVRDWRKKDGQGGRETKAAVQLRNRRPEKYGN